MINADFQYIGLSFSKDAYIANFQVPCEIFRKRRLFALNIRVTNGIWRNLCLLHLVHQIDRHLPAALEDTWASQTSDFFSTATSWTPKDSVGVVRILPYNHGFLVENGSENKFWGNTIFGAAVFHIERLRLGNSQTYRQVHFGRILRFDSASFPWGGWFINILRILFP